MKFMLHGIRYRVPCARGTSSSIAAILQFSTGKPSSAYAEWSDLQETPTESNRYRVRPIIRSQLVHQVLDMKIDGRLGNRQLIRNLLVAVSVSNEPKNFKLPVCKVFFAQMLSKTGCHCWRHVAISSVNRSDHTQQFVLGHAFKHVAGGA